MGQRKPSKKKRKLMGRLVGADPSLASAAGVFLYPWDRLEWLAAGLNCIKPDSPNRFIVELVERLLACPPTKQDWIKQENLAPIIGPTPCTPAPGSPLYVLNMFLGTHPCFLRIEGYERADGSIGVRATHIPIPPVKVFGIELMKPDLVSDRILWGLWEVLYRDIDRTRLKRCPICKRWFVDHTKRGNKGRCTTTCTSRRWSWGERRKANHRLRGVDGYKPRPRRRT
jgi:hypothetical protein